MLKDGDGESNFWVSYADLMAGLLFVFILLIGVIVSKSIILRNSLNKKEQKLSLTTEQLNERQKELKVKSQILENAQLKLKEKESILEQNRVRLKSLEQDLEDRKKALLMGSSRIDKQSLIITKQQRELRDAKEKIKLQSDEVKKLYVLLNQLKEKNRELDSKLKMKRSKLVSLEDNQSKLITLYQNRLELSKSDLKRLNQLLLVKNTKIDELNKKVVIMQNLLQETNTTLQKKDKRVQEYQGKVIILSKKLTAVENELRLRDRNLTNILNSLDNQKSRYEELLKKLQAQKAKIRSLTGIKLKIIDELKQTLGDRIKLDKRSGALRLSSNILFDKGSSTLKDKAKKELKNIFQKYVSSLMSNKAIKPHIDKIIIEGHTDSDGGYIYNLKLSQQRALAVMNYLLSLPISKKYNLKKYLLASGRAYMDRIMKNGKEDKEVSRRIEIKFNLKNEEAMYEIEKILDAD